MQKIYSQLEKKYALSDFVRRRDDLGFFTISKENLRALVQELRDAHGYSHLVLLTAVDWIEDGNFQLTYLLSNRKNATDLGIRVMLDRENASMQTIDDIWPTAATYQRELYEMFGIDFPGSPRLTEEFVLEGWQDIPPYRRDFDTKKFSEKEFVHREGRETHDPATHMKKQLYPDGN